MSFVRESVKVGDALITLETGRLAKQAHGSVLVTCGETMVLVTVCGSDAPRPGIDFFPLSVDYIEKTYAAGKIPGGFFKREGKLKDDEVLVSRLIDRPCRPLFPDGYRNDVQIIATVLSADKVNDPDVLSMTGASAALTLSDIPWAGPIAGVRVARINGKLVVNPTFEQRTHSDLDIVVAASKDAIVMVEGAADEVPEDEFLDALIFAHKAAQPMIALQEQLRAAVGKVKRPFVPALPPKALVDQVKAIALEDYRQACTIRVKSERYNRFKEISKKVTEAFASEPAEIMALVKVAIHDVQAFAMRTMITDRGVRIDGRNTRTVRPITCEVGLIPRTHGSALFTRGETQGLVTATLGTRPDEQKIDGLNGEKWKRFYLHYNFPPFSVGETKPMRGPGRREVGHGNLAERALARVMPSKEQFPYVVR
ncbi:MAG: polyribonucleotide nucleotidyltransferase, partial [Polyangiales bacterium]